MGSQEFGLHISVLQKPIFSHNNHTSENWNVFFSTRREPTRTIEREYSQGRGVTAQGGMASL